MSTIKEFQFFYKGLKHTLFIPPLERGTEGMGITSMVYCFNFLDLK